MEIKGNKKVGYNEMNWSNILLDISVESFATIILLEDVNGNIGRVCCTDGKLIFDTNMSKVFTLTITPLSIIYVDNNNNYIEKGSARFHREIMFVQKYVNKVKYESHMQWKQMIIFPSLKLITNLFRIFQWFPVILNSIPPYDLVENYIIIIIS